MLAQQPKHAQHAATQAIKSARGQARDARDGVVRRAHLLKVAGERFGDVEGVYQLGEVVAADLYTKAKATIAQLFVLALVDEAVIDASIGAHDLRLLQESVWREIDVPVFARPGLRDLACRIGIERGPGRALRNLPIEAIRRSVGLEA